MAVVAGWGKTHEIGDVSKYLREIEVRTHEIGDVSKYLREIEVSPGYKNLYPLSKRLASCGIVEVDLGFPSNPSIR